MESLETYSEILLDKLYKGELMAKIDGQYLGLDVSADLKLLDDKKSPDCYIENKTYRIEIRTERGIKGQKYESIEELKKDCYEQLKNNDIEPKQIVISDLAQMYMISFNTQTIKVQKIEDEIVLAYGVRKRPSQNLLLIPKDFAERNLSKEVIGLAKQSDDDYLWALKTTAFPVFFELPQICKVDFQEVLRGLIMSNMDYLRNNNLNDNVIFYVFEENERKNID